MGGEYNLPDGWELTTVEEFATTSSGGTPKRANKAYYGGDIPWVKSGELRDREVTSVEEFITGEGLANSSAKIFPKGTLCIAMYGATVGKLGVLGMDASTNQAVCALFPHEGIDVDFLRYFFRGKREELIAMGKGGAQPNISQTVIKEFPVCLPPFNEQRRIADKIDALQAKSRRARETLETVGPLLEKFRQSVLAAAFRGDLTADWRKQHPDVEPAEKLLERIRAERRAKWEEAELAKMRAKGKEPKNDKWKTKYKEPEPVDASGVPELPEGWCWAAVEEVADCCLGKMLDRKKHTVGNELEYLRNINVRWGEMDTTDMLGMFFKDTEIERYQIVKGDLLICEGGEPGRAAVWEKDEPVMFQKALHRLRSYGEIQPKWFMYHLWKDASLGILEPHFTGTTIKHMTGKALARYPIALAPQAEQDAILSHLQAIGKKIAQLSYSTEIQLCDVERLDQSILAKAFRGELVPQDPNDESASVLLERIKAERCGMKGKPKAKRRII